MNKTVEMNAQRFETEVVGSEAPVLVDFWAPWCAPCRHLAPILEELAAEYAGEVTFVKLNTDEHPALAARYGIFSIPTLILFRNGQPVRQWLGARPKKELASGLEQALRG